MRELLCHECFFEDNKVDGAGVPYVSYQAFETASVPVALRVLLSLENAESRRYWVQYSQQVSRQARLHFGTGVAAQQSSAQVQSDTQEAVVSQPDRSSQRDRNNERPSVSDIPLEEPCFGLNVLNLKLRSLLEVHSLLAIIAANEAQQGHRVAMFLQKNEELLSSLPRETELVDRLAQQLATDSNDLAATTALTTKQPPKTHANVSQTPGTLGELAQPPKRGRPRKTAIPPQQLESENTLQATTHPSQSPMTTPDQQGSEPSPPSAACRHRQQQQQ